MRWALIALTLALCAACTPVRWDVPEHCGVEYDRQGRRVASYCAVQP